MSLQEEQAEHQYKTLCRLFILSQCAQTLTVIDYEFEDERKWTDVCLDHVHEKPTGLTYLMTYVVQRNKVARNLIPDPDYNLVYDLGPLYYSPEPEDDHSFSRLFLGLDNKTIAAISHQPADFIKVCEVHGRMSAQCRSLMARGGTKRFLGSSYGLCYTYNVKDAGADIPLDSVATSNEYQGLELILDFEGTYCQN